jgi:hypothetical protein
VATDQTPNSVPPIEPTPVAGPPAVPVAPPPPVPPVPPAAPVVDPYAGSQQSPPPNPYAPGTPYAAAPNAYYNLPPYNTLAIVGFVLAFFVSIAAVVCGHIALSQLKRTNERGHGLALAAVIIGYAGIAFGILYVIFVLVLVFADASAFSD